MPEIAVRPDLDPDFDRGAGPGPRSGSVDDANRMCRLIRERSGMPPAMGFGWAGRLRAG